MANNNKESIGYLLFLLSFLFIPLGLIAQEAHVPISPIQAQFHSSVQIAQQPGSQVREFISQQSAMRAQHLQLIETIENESGPYNHRLGEPLLAMASWLKESGDYEGASKSFSRALHISRVNEGLYNRNQIPIVEDLILIGVATADWESVNNSYDYLELLYRRVYDEHDAAFARGLEKVNAWHVDAVNVDLDGNRIMHLRQAHKLFKLRLRIAESTLAGMEDPIFDFLKHNIALSEYYLYMFAGEDGSLMNKKLEAGFETIAIVD